MSKSIPPRGSEFSKAREFAAVLEDLRSQFRAFGDGLEGVTKKLDNLETEVSQIKSELSVVKSVVVATRSEMEKFGRRLTIIEAR